ncbi:hypothetical protein KKJ09_09445 [Xenorhabdus bovienii]|uniref:hypothetical protein n=1 Tax=Xenorhabdus bovienii TaxID=40576 RepID=UPI0023B2497D|nr:hypothetical protein [Xenorhabdus bovienii]MDE9493814.1 hypothetical protein [Xenorhabdus bovienii]MDE9502351.1 hypothetical protein [Xenorhabdus bovienii]MDE9527593.1 hypothetical protein [Xenorhabdus bovienii]MDE9570814.1 hypothetical protein [Xenorhabdus bovienii]
MSYTNTVVGLSYENCKIEKITLRNDGEAEIKYSRFNGAEKKSAKLIAKMEDDVDASHIMASMQYTTFLHHYIKEKTVNITTLDTADSDGLYRIVSVTTLP